MESPRHSGRRLPEAFIDTNVLLRYLLDDVPEQADAVESLLEQAADGKLVLHTNAMVLAELIWTCESYYHLPKDQIREKVLMILNTTGLQVEDYDLATEAVFLYVDKNIDFIDAYNGAWMKRHGLSIAYTFDRKHYNRIHGIAPKVPRR